MTSTDRNGCYLIEPLVQPEYCRTYFLCLQPSCYFFADLEVFTSESLMTNHSYCEDDPGPAVCVPCGQFPDPGEGDVHNAWLTCGTGAGILTRSMLLKKTDMSTADSLQILQISIQAVTMEYQSELRGSIQRMRPSPIIF